MVASILAQLSASADSGYDDAYRVFRKMLESGHPPDDWNQLLAEARTEGDRLQRIAAGVAQALP